MELHIVNSNSQGNGYVLEASNGDQLLLEAGRPLSDFRRFGRLRLANVKGMFVSHSHGDHSKCIKDFLKVGISVYSTANVADLHIGVYPIYPEETQHCGDFSVTPFPIKHDVPCYGYLIHHHECGTIFFATDCYNLKFAIKGINHYMMEVNYQDDALKESVVKGITPRSQADRVRLSHMSLEHAVAWLHLCQAEKTARTITLIHGSSRHLHPEEAVNLVRSEFGVPTYYAKKGNLIIFI